MLALLAASSPPAPAPPAPAPAASAPRGGPAAECDNLAAAVAAAAAAAVAAAAAADAASGSRCGALPGAAVGVESWSHRNSTLRCSPAAPCCQADPPPPAPVPAPPRPPPAPAAAAAGCTLKCEGLPSKPSRRPSDRRAPATPPPPPSGVSPKAAAAPVVADRERVTPLGPRPPPPAAPPRGPGRPADTDVATAAYSSDGPPLEVTAPGPLTIAAPAVAAPAEAAATGCTAAREGERSRLLLPPSPCGCGCSWPAGLEVNSEEPLPSDCSRAAGTPATPPNFPPSPSPSPSPPAARSLSLAASSAAWGLTAPELLAALRLRYRNTPAASAVTPTAAPTDAPMIAAWLLLPPESPLLLPPLLPPGGLLLLPPSLATKSMLARAQPTVPFRPSSVARAAGSPAMPLPLLSTFGRPMSPSRLPLARTLAAAVAQADW